MDTANKEIENSYVDFGNTYVAFLDILGWKDLVNKNSHEELIEIYKRVDSSTTNSLTGFKFKHEDNQFNPDLSEVRVNSLSISDSIIYWTNDNSAPSFFSIVDAVRHNLWEGIWRGIPMRGAIVYGPLASIQKKLPTVKHNFQSVLIGKSIVEAHTISEQQSWSGCVITNDCIENYKVELNKGLISLSIPERIVNKITIDSLVNRGRLKRYLVPYKEQNNGEEITINWVNASNPKFTEVAVRQSFEANKKNTKDDKVQNIIKNTISYWADCPERMDGKK